jgi:DNA-binding FrmR family transcriptional regulator
VNRTVPKKQKLISRVRRVRGQLEGIEKALIEEKGCYEILQTVAAARGALNSLLAEIVEDHIRFHVLDPDEKPSAKQSRAAEELIEVVRTYSSSEMEKTMGTSAVQKTVEALIDVEVEVERALIAGLEDAGIALEPVDLRL